MTITGDYCIEKFTQYYIIYRKVMMRTPFSKNKEASFHSYHEWTHSKYSKMQGNVILI